MMRKILNFSWIASYALVKGKEEVDPPWADKATSIGVG